MLVTVTLIVAVRLIALKKDFQLKQLHRMPKSPTVLSQERHKKQ